MPPGVGSVRRRSPGQPNRHPSPAWLIVAPISPAGPVVAVEYPLIAERRSVPSARLRVGAPAQFPLGDGQVTAQIVRATRHGCEEGSEEAAARVRGAQVRGEAVPVALARVV